MLIINFFFYRI